MGDFFSLDKLIFGIYNNSMNIFRPRLYHFEDEDQLWKYFEKRAGYHEQTQCYMCAGLFADDTAELFEKLKAEWQEDRARHTTELAKRLLKGPVG